MQKIEPRTLKGFRDFLPQEARKRQYVIDILRRVFESYGFEPLETPALEYEDILLGKYGDEGDRLMYLFEDHGKRKVALRYDQTVPLARVVAQYANELPMPFKRYQIQNVWRAENTQKGRYREFLQCDIDTIGEKSIGCDFEIIQIVNTCLTKLGFENYKILINDRANFEGIEASAILTIDKLKKIGADAVRQELRDKGFDENLLEQVSNKQPTPLIKNILSNQSEIGVGPLFEPTLARGLDYYTGIIIEVEIEGFDAGSVGGGGRYDDLIGMFGKTSIPAVGFAFGFDRLLTAMEEKNLFPHLSTAKVLVTVPSIELEEISIKIGSMLRENNINTDVYLTSHASMEKQFKYAEKKGIPFVIVPLDSENIEMRSKSKDNQITKTKLRIDQIVDQFKYSV